MVQLANRAQMQTSTTGAGTITLGTATTNYQSFAAAGVSDADTVSYLIEDGVDWEVGTGTYSSTGPTLSRSPSESTNAGAAIILSGFAIVTLTALSSDILQPNNNLSDLPNAATARSNLGLGTMAVEAATDYAELAGATFTGAVLGTSLSLSETLSLHEAVEKASIDASALTGTYNFNVLDGAVVLNTTDASANWTLNLRGDGANTLDSVMSVGDSITVAHITQQGATAYYASAVTVDGASVTPNWQGGSAPSSGNTSSLDVYTITVIKTASSTFTVLGALTQFA